LLIEHPHHFTTVASGCSVGAPLGRLLMHVQIYIIFPDILDNIGHSFSKV